MKQHISNFISGLNKDTSFDSVTNSALLHAEDIRIFTENGNTNSAIINVKGHKLAITLVNAGEQVIGFTTIRNFIVYFTADSTNSHGRIYKLAYNAYTKEIVSNTLIYDHPDMGFSINNPIEAISRYEDDCTQRVIFSDYSNYTRSINIADSCFSTGAYLNTSSYCGIEPKDLDIFQNFCFKNPTIADVLSGGSLISGIYQHAYYLISKDGKKTLNAPATSQVSIYPNSTSYNSSLTGGNEGEDAGKSISLKFDLSNIDLDNFAQLVPVRLFYNTINGIPFVHTLTPINIITGVNSYEIVDSGNDIGQVEITYEEYSRNTFVFKTNKTFGIKDNLLVYSNIKEECFELDCIDKEEFLAVRYLNSTISPFPVTDISNDLYTITNFPGITTNAIEAKYYNPYNDESGKVFGNSPLGSPFDWDTTQQFKYQSDRTTLGGETISGNLRYEFTLEQYDNHAPGVPRSINLNDGYITSSATHNSIGDPIQGNLLKGYKRGEVYRFGIVFFSKKKSLPSYVYPLGDIRFPDISDDAGYETVPGTGITNFPVSKVISGSVKCFALGIKFEFNFPQCLLDQVCGYQIVRVERTQFDKTKLTQGLIKKYSETTDDPANEGITYTVDPFMDSITEYALPTSTGSRVSKRDLVSYFSPEISYNFNNLTFKSGDYLKAVGIGNEVTTYDDNAPSIPGTEVVNSINEIDKIPLHTDPKHREELEDSEYVFAGVGNRTLRNFSNLFIRNYSVDGGNFQNVGGKGSFLGTNVVTKLKGSVPYFMGDTSSNFTNTNNTITINEPKAATGGYIIDYSRYLFNQYGGQGSNKFSYNTFAPCTNMIDISNTSSNVYQGDTFIGLYDFMFNFWDDYAKEIFSLGSNTQNNNSYYHVVYIGLETSINLDLTNGFTWHKGTGGYDFNDNGSHDGWRSKEINNLNGPYFKYNPVYSRNRNDKSFFPKPIDLIDCGCNITRDVRSYISDPKINGETIDSWSNIRINNFKDVDSQYGPINRILNLRDELFYLQDRSFGKFTINPRAVISTNDGIPTELGTAQGLQDYQYLSTKYGCIHQYGCIATDTSIYYFDALNKKMMQYGGQGGGAISDVKGLHGFFNDSLRGDVLLTKDVGGDNPLIDKGIHCTYDYQTKQIFWTFLGVDIFINLNDYPLILTTPLIVPAGAVLFYNGIYYKYDEYLLPVTLNIGDNVFDFVNDFLEGTFNINETYRNGYTVSYNEMVGAYEAYYKFVPRIYLNNSNIIVSPKPQDYNIITGFADILYTHNVGNYGEYYGNAPIEAMTALVVNSEADINKILRFIEFNSTVNPKKYKGSFYNHKYDEKQDSIRNETISSIRIYNDTQDTGKIDLTTTKLFKGQTVSKYLKRKFDKWRVNIPRDAQISDFRVNHSNVGKSRLRSTYFVVELYYQNNNDKEFVLNRIISHYDFQMF